MQDMACMFKGLARAHSLDAITYQLLDLLRAIRRDLQALQLQLAHHDTE